MTQQNKQPEIEKIALFDMDGTLADYSGQMNRDLKRMQGPDEKTYEMDFDGEIPDHIEQRMSVIKLIPGWWRNLPVLADGVAILNQAIQMGFDPHILTKGPFKTTSAWEEKVIWCRENLDSAGITKTPIKITITEDKGLVYGRMLVDDWPPYITRWLANRPRGLVIMPDRNYNKDFSHPQVIRYDHSSDVSRNEVSGKMLEAFKR